MCTTSEQPEDIVSCETTLVPKAADEQQASISEFDARKEGFFLESPEEVRALVRRFLDLVENRRYQHNLESRASQELRVASLKRQELSDPKVLPRSERLAAGKGPRVPAILDKGREYERKRTERTEKQAAKEKAECTFRPKVLTKPS